MTDSKTQFYADRLARMIQAETVCAVPQIDKTKFYRFYDLQRSLFPHLFSVVEVEDFDGSLLLRWKGSEGGEPIMLMNHSDTVDAKGAWRYDPFSGTCADGKLWGRGALDTKGGLFCMLQAADELAESGFVPSRDLYFVTTCNEECSGEGADRISKTLLERGIRFYMVLDEGGMLLQEPIDGAKGTYAMVGVGEKGCADLKFVARSVGGHASTPGKNTPLVRLGKFMAEAEKGRIFPVKLSPTLCAMFASVAESMSGMMKLVLGHPRLFSPILTGILPRVSTTAAAMLRTTVAFTMAQGSEGANVLPQEAWVIGNMRYSHHQGKEKSIAAIAKLAEKYGIETVVLDGGEDSSLSDHATPAFALIEQAVRENFKDVRTSPYIMTGASDCRYMSRICDNCFRLTPFLISQEQMESIHAIDENVDLSALEPAVRFYQYLIKEAQK